MKNKFISLMILLLIIVFSSQICTAAKVRDPFMDYKLSEEFLDQENTLDDMKAKLPFNLSGIIASDRDRIAIINVGGTTEFIKNAYEKDDFKITYIGENRISIKYHSLKAYMKIGGDLIAADK